MADDSEMVRYVREQISAGYSDDDIREALAGQGWGRDEIERTFGAARKSLSKKPEGKSSGSPETGQDSSGLSGRQPMRIEPGFVLSLAAGVLVIVNALLVFAEAGDLLAVFIHETELSFLGMFGLQVSPLDSLIVNAIIGGFLLAAGFIIHFMPERARLTGIFMLILSSLTLLTGNGFLVGGVVAVAGGILAIMRI